MLINSPLTLTLEKSENLQLSSHGDNLYDVNGVD